tara:strand:+ start:17892 stop:18206 length:315 start_codon:yes stop_codon:yes gene_type:complete
MAKELSEDTAVKLSLKTLGGIAALISILVGMWFTLQADIAEAKALPKNEWNPDWEEKLPDPDITRMEFDMKDQNIRITIQNTEKAVDDLKDRLIRMEEKLDKLR